MSATWTAAQLEAASAAMKEMGFMSYEEFCEALDRPAYPYYMIQRHMGSDTLPSGVVKMEVWNSRPYTPAVGGACFGIVYFDRMLSRREQESYGLIPS